MMKILVKINNKLNSKSKFFFCKRTKVETFIYIMNDKHSIKPEKEYRLIHELKHELDKETNTEKTELIKYGNNFD